MACSCNCDPCNCQPSPSTCCTPTTESVEYTFENANLAGVGVFDNDTDNLVQFRGIVSNSVALTVTLNAVDNTIVLDFDDATLVADIPDATTAQRGILETATNAEALAKAAADKILTPSNLAALGSTDTFAGLVELATNAETITGTSSTLAVTPAGVAATLALGRTVTWADAATRAGATPAFDGQFGTQLDTNAPYVANGAVAGDFDIPILALGITNESPANTTVNMNADALTLVGVGDFILNTVTLLVDGATSTFSNSTTFFGLAGFTQIVDFQDTRFSIGNAPMGGETLLGADNSGFGTAFEYAIADFLSSYNVQTGYTAFANGVVRRTCDTTTVTLPELAQIVGTLIEDLKAIQLPAT